MSAQKITVDDLREKAEGIRDSVREDARHALYDETVKMVVAGAVVVAVAVSLAFYLGTRRGRR